MNQQKSTLNKDQNVVNLEVAVFIKHGDYRGKYSKDGVDIGAKHGDGAEEVVQFVRLVEGVGELLDLDEGSDAGNDGEGQDDNLCSVVDPEHFSSKLIAVFHDEEDDDNDDAANQAQQTKEQT